MYFQIEEVQWNNALSHGQFSLKICSLFNILQIALSTYIRNLRNFINNGVPEKIVSLLQSIRDATMICVERNIFDRDDVVVAVRLFVVI